MSVEERKIRSELSNNMLNLINNSRGQVLIDSVKPYFRREDYSEGILNYLKKLEYEYDNNSKYDSSSKILFEELKSIFIIFVPFVILLFTIFKFLVNSSKKYAGNLNLNKDNSSPMTPIHHNSNNELDNFLTTSAIISSTNDFSSSSSSYDSSSSSSSFDGGGFDGGGFDGGW